MSDNIIFNWREVHFNDNGSDPGIYKEWQTDMSANFGIFSGMITIYPMWEHGIYTEEKWQIRFENKKVCQEFISMFQLEPPIIFSSAKEAKEHVELFFNKFNKLKMFA